MKSIRNRFGSLLVVAGAMALNAVVMGQVGTVMAWGNNQYGQCDVPSDLGLCSKISAGFWHSVALKVDGRIVAWGSNDGGACEIPANLPPCVDIDAGAGGTYAITNTGQLVGWGNIFPIPEGLGQVRQVSYGGHVMAIKMDGTVVGWGRNAYGQCNPPLDLGPCIQVSAGGGKDQPEGLSAAVRIDGMVRVWGNPWYGALDVPATLGPCTRVTTSEQRVMALTTNGEVVSWGGNSYCDQGVPGDIGSCRGISGGEWHHLAVRQDGSAVVWGCIRGGEIDVPYPLYLPLGTSDVSAGQWHSLAISLPPEPQGDLDSDGIINSLDNCPFTSNPSQTDCNNNGIGDACEIFIDCNKNGIPDACDLTSGVAADWNLNSIPDSCDIANNLLNDFDKNGIPDSQELLAARNQILNLTSQLSAVTAQLQCGDLDGSGDVGSEDLGLLLLNYGPCPN